jgi:hypothetical protein
MKNKNLDLLTEFSAYCAEHPEQRFWQALRNWSGADNIMAAGTPGLDAEDQYELADTHNTHDTFFWKEKNEIPQ